MPAPAGLDLPLVRAVETVRLTGEVSGVVEGVLVRGLLRAIANVQCARCLADLRINTEADVAELFTDPSRVDEWVVGAAAQDVIEEGYEITDGSIDLDMLVRDAVALALPYQPLCDPTCRGLCPLCGSNRNEVECACVQPEADSRWAALEALRLPSDLGSSTYPPNPTRPWRRKPSGCPEA